MSYKFIMPYLITATAVTYNGNPKQLDTSSHDYDTDSTKTEFVTKMDSLTCDRTTDSVAHIEPKVIAVNSHGANVVYTYSDSIKVVRHSDGSRAWRNNNPGNLRYYDFARSHGAIGEAGGFAVFPDEQTGMDALRALLRTNTYQVLTIQQAICRYATYDTARYIQQLKKLTGLTSQTKLKNLNDKQLLAVANAIRTIEGWKSGTENLQTPTSYPYAVCVTQINNNRQI